jgi:hypothetical protein
VIRWLSPVADQPEDNGAGRSSGVNLLGDYIDRTYEPVRRFGDYQVLAVRKQPARPAAQRPPIPGRTPGPQASSAAAPS